MESITANRVKQAAMDFGADLCGIAAVSSFGGAPAGFHPTDVFPECRSIIVLARRFPHSSLQGRSNVPYTLVRNLLVTQMDQLACQLSDWLEQNDVTAMPIPSAEPYEYWNAENRHGRGIISLKHSAVLAGLGIMGKNTLLVNNKYGNMIWLSAVLTGCHLEPDPRADYQPCPEKCRICLDICPVQALDGATINQSRCRSQSGASSDGGGWYLACNLCRKSCPRHLGIKNN